MRKNVLGILSCLFLTLFTFLSCNGPQEAVLIFGNSITTESKMMHQSHDRGFLKLNKLSALHYNLIPDFSKKEMVALSSIILSKVKPKIDRKEVVNIFVFTTNKDGSSQEIKIDETHAFSIFSNSDGGLRHQYFEKKDETEFVKIPSLSTILKGGFSYDDVRMLHFAAIGKNGLPKESTIYEFSSNEFVDHRDFEEVDFGLRQALLLDNHRYWAASTTGLYGEELQLALMADDQPGGGSSCGFVNPGPSLDNGPLDPNTGCPQGANPCYNDPIAGTKKYCTKKDTGGCFAATASVMKAVGWPADEGVDFIKIWNFQDEFLLKHDMGKGYMATSLFYSLFVSPDRESLTMAKVALPEMYRAMDLLMSDKPELDQTVVVTPELYESVMNYIKMGRQIDNKKLQRVLDSWENDLNTFLGLPRNEFINYFESTPSKSFMDY